MLVRFIRRYVVDVFKASAFMGKVKEGEKEVAVCFVDEIHRKLKAKAAIEGRSLRSVLWDLSVEWLEKPAEIKKDG